MSKLRTLNLDLHWSEVETDTVHDVLIAGGVTPGGESVKVRLRLVSRDSLGYIGQALHEAINKREAELQSARAKLEGRCK